jgi:hypothetical protein
MINEDAPTNNIGSGAIAGAGIGPMGEPGVSVKAQRKRQRNEKSTPTPVIINMLRRKAPNPIAEEFNTFAGAIVFEVSSTTFHNARTEKRKGKHWRTYLDECDELAEIREYANKNPGKPIVLQNRNTNEMCYVRYGKAR